MNTRQKSQANDSELTFYTFALSAVNWYLARRLDIERIPDRNTGSARKPRILLFYYGHSEQDPSME
jgi:hypothetical protein